jgi:hypothetical protein
MPRRRPYLADFVNNGDNYYDVVFEKGAVTPLLDLKKAFTNHMRFTNEGVEWKWKSDYHAIRSRGYEVQRLNVCKVCGGVGSKKACGDHYMGGKNRKRVWSVLHMRIKTDKDVDMMDL